MGVQGAAAGLDGRRVDFAAIGEEDVGGIAVDVRKCQVLDTTGEKGDAAADRSGGWLHFGNEFM